MPSIAGVGAYAGDSARAAYGQRAQGGGASAQLSEDQLQQVKELEKRDREVRQHEQAHLSAAGGYAKGGPTFSYTRGPDGKQYATGGEVQIDVSPGRTPQETIAKAQVIQRAAQAPAEPSGQDRAVAAAAARMEQQARQQLAQQAVDKGKQQSSGAVQQAVQTGQRRPAYPADTSTDTGQGLDLVA